MSDLSYTKLDAVFHSRIRLAVVAALTAASEMDFTSLRDIVGATDGNMNVHLKKLEEAGYVSVQKRFVKRKPVSTYRLTEKGRKNFKKYVETLEGFIR